MGMFLVVLGRSGPRWQPGRPLEEQVGWPAHASYMDGLVDAGFIVLGGPLSDEQRVVHAVQADSAEEVRATLARDPWSGTHLVVDSIQAWTIRLDARHPDRPAGPTGREDRDIFRLAPGVDAAVLETIAARLEFRGTDDGYARLSQDYFTRLPLADARRVLAIGCGTGIEVRALRRMAGPHPAIVGVDHSPALIEVARRLTTDEGLADNVTYRAGDAHHLPFDDDEFDIVTLHTLISHADDPVQVLREAGRVVRPGGTVAIFDGDYASLTFAYPDHALAKAVEESLMRLVVANPRVMRDMPQLLAQAGLELVDAAGTLYADIGAGGFWFGATQSYGALLARSGLLPPAVVEDWRAFQARSAAAHSFFGASNYYTYLARRPDAGGPRPAAAETG
jgi:SAM-dependent methyltransferase